MLARSPDVMDVIIIGGGIIGASTAWRLAQAGAAVTLVDAGALGGEASWAGAGMPGAGGGVARAGTEAEWRDLMARRAAQSELGIRSEVTGGGLFYPDDALVDPRDVTRALGCACEKRRVRIREQTRVLAVRVTRELAEVETSGGVLAGSAAVLAAGAWSGQIPVFGPGGRIEIPASFPVRGHLLGYALEPGSLGPILRHGHTYVMQRSSGFTIAGTSSEQVGFNRELDPLVVDEIRARAGELLPRLRLAAEPIAWLGFRPATEGVEPAVGRLEDTCLW